MVLLRNWFNAITPIVQLQSPAKINLFLRILGARPDGYHNLSMLMEKISLCDEITLEKTAAGIEVSVESGDIPLEKNLVYRAARALKEAFGVDKGARIHLKKNIPIGGGLGGGSGNGATVLKGLNELWGIRAPLEELARIGQTLGADVPFFLREGPAWVGGTGEQITPLENFPKLPIILINPGVSVATSWAYAAWDTASFRESGRERGKGLTQENQSVRRLFTLADAAGLLFNDFEEVVFPRFPEIRAAKEALLEAGAKGALMSGSGSTVFGLFGTKEERERALERLKVEPRWTIFSVENGK